MCDHLLYPFEARTIGRSVVGKIADSVFLFHSPRAFAAGSAFIVLENNYSSHFTLSLLLLSLSFYVPLSLRFLALVSIVIELLMMVTGAGAAWR